MKPLNKNKQPISIFALIIGINTYHEIYFDLQCAEADADAVARFLMESLDVSSDNIINLRGKDATRAAIIAGFELLDTKIGEMTEKWAGGDSVHKDDVAIIIYFAGHGARSPMPKEWVGEWFARESQVEMICPTDIGTVKDNHVIDGIPDRTISALISKLSNERGNNITVILDCCHAAGLTRTVAGGLVARRILNHPSIQKDCDHVIWNSIPRGVIRGNRWGPLRDSHVLLAGCGRDESAYEDPATQRGLFTTALLKLLENTDIDGITYSSLMHKIPMPVFQNPHCEGRNMHRKLFNSRATGADRSFLLGRCEDGISTLDAGAALGIQVNSKFEIYDSNILTKANAPLGSVKVTLVNTSTVTVIPIPDAKPFILPKRFYAKGAGLDPNDKLRLFCTEQNRLGAPFLSALDDLDKQPFSMVESPDLADLCVSIEGDRITFERTDHRINAHISARLPHTLSVHEPDAFFRVLNCAASFNYHLTRTGAHIDQVRMELHELKYEPVGNFFPATVPVGENLIATNPATVLVQGAHLGLTIHNDTDVSLYPYVFYFDPSNLSIQDWYLGPVGVIGGSVDPPLPKRSKLTIGFGDGGEMPWQFDLNDDEDRDVGFLKLFLSTSHVNLSSIVQGNPFQRVNQISRGAIDIWGSTTVTILQVRPAVVIPGQQQQPS